MQAHILSLHTLQPQGLGLNGNFLTESIVMLHIELKGMVQRASFKHVFCPYTYSW